VRSSRKGAGENVGESVASEPAEQRKVRRAAPHRHRARHSAFDAWLIWSIAVIAIGFPALFLICVSSIPAGKLDFADLHVAVGRGEFLVPVLIMCAESIRRWTREVKGGLRVLVFQIIAGVGCALAGIVCMTAAIISAMAAATPMTGRSLTTITVACIVVGGMFGTAGVVIKPGVA
jgi:hypothetical protein